MSLTDQGMEAGYSQGAQCMVNGENAAQEAGYCLRYESPVQGRHKRPQQDNSIPHPPSEPTDFLTVTEAASWTNKNFFGPLKSRPVAEALAAAVGLGVGL